MKQKYLLAVMVVILFIPFQFGFNKGRVVAETTNEKLFLPLIVKPPYLPLQGLYVQFERRGWDSGFWSGQVINKFDDYDDVLGHKVSDEVSLQLDEMKKIGVNAIAFELRAASPTNGNFEPPDCIIGPALGLQFVVTWSGQDQAAGVKGYAVQSREWDTTTST